MDVTAPLWLEELQAAAKTIKIDAESRLMMLFITLPFV